jgi:Ras-related protein Rab-2A
MMLIGNKADLTSKREVTYQEACSLASKMGAIYIETSAKTSHNITDSFSTACSKILAKITNKEIDVNDAVNSL